MLTAPTINNVRFFYGGFESFSTSGATPNSGGRLFQGGIYVPAGGAYRLGTIKCRIDFTSNAPGATHHVVQTSGGNSDVFAPDGVNSIILDMGLSGSYVFGNSVAVEIRAETATDTSPWVTSSGDVRLSAVPDQPSTAFSSIHVASEDFPSTINLTPITIGSIDTVTLAWTVDSDLIAVRNQVTCIDTVTGNVLAGYDSNAELGNDVSRSGGTVNLSRYISGAWPTVQATIGLAAYVADGINPGTNDGLNRPYISFGIGAMVTHTFAFNPASPSSRTISSGPFSFSGAQWSVISGSVAGRIWTASIAASGLPSGFTTSVDTSQQFPVLNFSGVATVAPASLSFTVTGTSTDTHTDTATVNIAVTPAPNPHPPAIISPLTGIPVKAVPFSYTVGLLGVGTTVTAVVSTPNGLSASGSGTTTCVISGTPTSAGVTTSVALTATDIYGATVTATLVLVSKAIIITSVLAVDATMGTTFSYATTVSGTATSYSGAVPAGLTLNTSTGAITGIPTNSGTFNVALTANASGGSDTQAIVFTIATPAQFAATGGVGAALSYANPLIAGATSYAATAGAPVSSPLNGTPVGGVTFDTTNGNFAGTPDATWLSGGLATTTEITIVGGPSGSGTQLLELTIEPALTITDPGVLYARKSEAIASFPITTSTAAVTVTDSGLPAGLTSSVIAGVATITGTATTSAGSYIATITITDATPETQVLKLAVVVYEISTRDLSDVNRVIRTGNAGVDMVVDTLDRNNPIAPMLSLPTNLFYTSVTEPAFFNVWFTKGAFLDDFSVLAVRFAVKAVTNGTLIYGSASFKRVVNAVAPFYTMEAVFTASQLAALAVQVGATGENAITGQLEIDIDAPFIQAGKKLEVVCPSLTGMAFM